MKKYDLKEVQTYLEMLNLDGWLMYDFRGQNYIANAFLDIRKESILTRRWFYFIPKTGQPLFVVHKIERDNFPENSEIKHFYVSWHELQVKLKSILQGCTTVAMEYSPNAAIPYVSCVYEVKLMFIIQMQVLKCLALFKKR